MSAAGNVAARTLWAKEFLVGIRIEVVAGDKATLESHFRAPARGEGAVAQGGAFAEPWAH